MSDPYHFGERSGKVVVGPKVDMVFVVFADGMNLWSAARER